MKDLRPPTWPPPAEREEEIPVAGVRLKTAVMAGLAYTVVLPPTGGRLVGGSV